MGPEKEVARRLGADGPCESVMAALVARGLSALEVFQDGPSAGPWDGCHCMCLCVLDHQGGPCSAWATTHMLLHVCTCRCGYARIVGDGIDLFVRKFEVVMGRNSNKASELDIVLGDSMNISRQHAKIVYNFGNKHYELIVLGKNGVVVGQNLYTPSSPPLPLKSKDVLIVAEKTLCFLLPRLPVGAQAACAAIAKKRAAEGLGGAPGHEAGPEAKIPRQEAPPAGIVAPPLPPIAHAPMPPMPQPPTPPPQPQLLLSQQQQPMQPVLTSQPQQQPTVGLEIAAPAVAGMQEGPVAVLQQGDAWASVAMGLGAPGYNGAL